MAAIGPADRIYVKSEWHDPCLVETAYREGCLRNHLIPTMLKIDGPRGNAEGCVFQLNEEGIGHASFYV
jgi:hypothetical protein